MSHINHISNINISSEMRLTPPIGIKAEFPLTKETANFVYHERMAIANIINKKDPRLLVICGPCSIHELGSAMEYATKLNELKIKYSKTLNIIMRVYFEKPRTTIGWKGYINDPHIDGSFDMEYGLRKARQLLLWLSNLGLPAATEALDPIVPQYLSDLISWSAIGARTTESQTHRDMASGLSMPVGFKNSTDGNLLIAINGIKAAASSQRFLGVNQEGRISLFTTKGNPHGHIILRGGSKPNYDEASIHDVETALEQASIDPAVLIDCSHGNSNKDYRQQPLVAEEVLSQIKSGNRSIIGIMLESHLYEGNQSCEQVKKSMQYGVSITDGCINWSTTEDLIAMYHETMSNLHRK